MWMIIALLLTIVLLVLMSFYIQRDFILGCNNLKNRVAAFVPAKFPYRVLLVVAFVLGIVSFGMQYNYFSDYIRAAKLTTLAMLLVLIAYVDLKTKVIPNGLVLAGFIARAVFYIIEVAIVQELPNSIASDLLGLLLGGGVFFMGAVVAKNSIGMGDVKLYALAGIFCGSQITFVLVVFSLLLCFVTSIVLLVCGKKGMKDTLPLAPFVLVAMLLIIGLGY